MMVPRREQQAQLLVQAVQNHTPQVIIVDEIGTKQVNDSCDGTSSIEELAPSHGHTCWV
jgi:stage III sporulation protein SpoIIIAA